MGVIERLLQEIPVACRARRFRSRGCSISIRGNVFDISVLFDANKIASGRKGNLCDFIFVGRQRSTKQIWVFCVEFKAGRLIGSEVGKQLAGGARIAETLVRSAEFHHFVPIVVFGGKAHRDEIDYLEGNPIRFHSATRAAVPQKKSIVITEDTLDRLRI